MDKNASYRQLVLLVSQKNLVLGLKQVKSLGLKVSRKIINNSGVWLISKTSLRGAATVVPVLIRLRNSENRRIFPTVKSQTYLKGADALAFEKTLKAFPLGPVGKIPETSRLWVDPRGLPAKGPRADTIYLRYGEAFGAGNHPTTKISAGMLYERRGLFKKPRVLDLGCGTGVLSMAAKKWGVETVWAIDNDPTVLKIASRNFKNNRVHGVVLRERIDPCPLKFQVVIVNINLPAVLLLRKVVEARLHPKGFVILGGLEHRDVPQALRAYSRFARVESVSDGKWTNLLLKRKRVI